VAGTTITWSATATGGDQPLQYRYNLSNAATAKWTIAQDYSAASTWTWTPSQGGEYEVRVWVRNAGSTADYDAWKGSGNIYIAR